MVDDDESARRSCGRWLRAAGFLPVEYPTAESFLEDRRRPDFQCLVLDVRLPGISGLELAHHLASVNDRTPVVYLTAQDDPEARRAALATGGVGFFLKTDKGELVLEALRRATGTPGADADSPGGPPTIAPVRAATLRCLP